MSSFTTSLSQTERITAAIEYWKRKLLDLSRRNRALNFRMNRVSTVAVVDELPSHTFQQLVIKEGSMRFRAILPESEEKPFTNGNAGFDPGDVEDGIVQPPVQEEKLDPKRHYDDVLQAHAGPSQLDRSLRRLSEQAQTTIEEQGVNTLYLALGMLHYRDSAEPDRELSAPIVLLPVALSRRAAGAGFTLRAAEDEPVINPALSEYLRRTYSLTLPALPDPLPDDFDLQMLLDEVAALVAERKDWSVRPEIYLALFAFQKLVMYRDLETHAEHFLLHRLIRQVITREGQVVAGLPKEIEDLDLDEAFPPESTAQVVDADSSQMRAIAAVAKGNDLVLEGPPGTGKSQTITNLIGKALADGKTVLFVAEKMAALNVVHRRLTDAGLGEFCLELHSTKTNKRAVLSSIRAALDASLQAPPPPTLSKERLPGVRTTLNEYARAVHDPFGALGLSPFAAYGEFGAVLNAPRVRFTRRIDDVTRVQLAETLEALQLFDRAVQEIGDPNRHPWRDSTRTYFPTSDLDAIEALLAELSKALGDLQDLATRAEAAYGLAPVRRSADIEVARMVGTLLEQSPGAPAAVLRSPAWNAPPPRALELVERGRRLSTLRAHLEPRLKPEAFDADHTAEITFIEEKEAGLLRLFNPLNSRYRVIRNRWTALRLAGYAPSMIEQLEDMKQADQLRRERTFLAGVEPEARALFGTLWHGESSDWDALAAYIRWVVDFRAACVQHGLHDKATTLAAQAHPDVGLLQKLTSAAAGVDERLSRLRTLVQWPEQYLADLPFEAIAARVREMATALDLAPRWAAYEAARARIEQSPAAELLPQALASEVAFADLPGAFQRAFYQRWLDEAVGARPALRQFHTLTHEQRIEEFRRLDRDVLRDNRQALISRLRNHTQSLLREPEIARQLGFLRGQINRQRGHAPLRRTFREAGAAVRAVKPCFLMSPLTVAQFLENPAQSFDLVVFDEASQLTAEDAVGAIARGEQLVVVGDPKQLPPTNFFAVIAGQVTTDLDENGDPVVEETESILEECLGSGMPTTRLKWHYRSREESLITFSNATFYDGDLNTFPSVYTDAHTRGLTFEYVADGVYEGKGLNLVEARRVADAVVAHAKAHPDVSLGVGTFNLRQQVAILDELEVRRRQDPSIEPFFAGDREEPFFVKNLENIQGDERDVIFLSITYAKNREGVLRHNFGPINGENGWRRLNVIATRARQHMRVFSSMKGDEIDLTKTPAAGARLLREFLLYAERALLSSTMAERLAPAESTFEVDVYRELTARGLKLQPKVGVAGYRIDFGVLDERVPGRFVCGIECDGPAYQGSATARDRDRLRQQVLSDRGWRLHRVWSTDWFKDRRGQVERILALVEKSRTEALAPAAAPKETPPEPPVLAASGGNGQPAPEKDAQEPVPVEPYRQAKLRKRKPRVPLHEMSAFDLIPTIQAIVEAEAPLHFEDLADRLTESFGVSRSGPRVLEHIARVCAIAESQGFLRHSGEFIWGMQDAVVLRSREGTGIPAERIAPEEYLLAVATVLRERGALDRKALLAEVRDLFGYARTTPALEQSVTTAVDTLLQRSIIGEGGTGLVLREQSGG